MKLKDVLHLAVGILVYATIVSNAVPVNRKVRDVHVILANSSVPTECLHEDILYQAGDEVPSPGPCEQCVCKPPKVECSMIKCKTFSGCKMIQRPNHCCPDYMCDCDYKGRVYNNGERLELEDTPCQVCYCKGGEIMCTSITCYERTDCEPRYVPGQCCPKYDHCPLENNGNTTLNSTVIGSKREIQPWLMTKPVTVKPIEVIKQTTIKSADEKTQPPNIYPQTLKIHEILPTTTVKYERPNGKRPNLSTAAKPPQEVVEKQVSDVEISTISNVEDSSITVKTPNDDERGSTLPMSSSDSVVSDDEEDEEGNSTPSTIFETTRVETFTNNSTEHLLENLESDNETVSETNYKENSLGTTEGSLNSKNSEISDSLTENITEATNNSISNNKSVKPNERLANENVRNSFDEDPLGHSDVEFNDNAENTSAKTELTDLSTSISSIVIDSSTTEGPVTKTYEELGDDLPDDEGNLIQVKPENGSNGEQELDVEWVTLSPEPTAGGKVAQEKFDEESGYIMTDGATKSFSKVSEFTQAVPDSNTEIDLGIEAIVPTRSTFDNHDESLVLIGGIYDELNDTVLYTDDNDVSKGETTIVDEDIGSTTSSPENSSFAPEPSALSEVFEKFIEFPQSSGSSIRRSDDWLSDSIQYIPGDGNEDEMDLHVGATSHSAKVSPAYFFNEDDDIGMSGRSLAPYNDKNNKNTFVNKSDGKKFQTEFNKIVSDDSNANETETEQMILADQTLYLSITGKNSSSNETILHLILTPKDLKYLAEQIIKENINKTESNLRETEVKIEWLTQDQLTKLKSNSSVNINLSKCNLTKLTDLKTDTLKSLRNIENYNNETVTTTLNSTVETTTLPFSSTTELLRNSNKPNNTIKIYEIIKTSDSFEKVIDPSTTDGPYTLSSTNKNDEIESSTASKDNEYETATPSSDKPRKKNLPNVEPFLKQLPSTLDEKDVSILRDFLERHLSEPLSR